MTALNLIISDAGRSTSRRPRQNNDCTVRALAMVRNLPYDDAYDLLKQGGRVSGQKFNFKDWLQDKSWAHKISFPAIKGQSRMNPVSFTQKYPQGTFLCFVAKHVFACIDGVIYDDALIRADRCIYTAWEIIDPNATLGGAVHSLNAGD